MKGESLSKTGNEKMINIVKQIRLQPGGAESPK